MLSIKTFLTSVHDPNVGLEYRTSQVFRFQLNMIEIQNLCFFAKILGSNHVLTHLQYLTLIRLILSQAKLKICSINFTKKLDGTNDFYRFKKYILFHAPLR